MADHSLISFRHFWAAETKRRGTVARPGGRRALSVPGRRPTGPVAGNGRARGARRGRRRRLDRRSVHHGIGYGDPAVRALDPVEGGLDLARATIEEGIDLLGRGDYAAYDAHCLEAKSDARDAGVIFRHLRGELRERSSTWPTRMPPSSTRRRPRPGSPRRSSSGRGGSSRRARARAAASRATRRRRPRRPRLPRGRCSRVRALPSRTRA